MVNCGCYPDVYHCGDKRYNLIKEELSVSYLKTICSYIGASLNINDRRMDSKGYDVTIALPPYGTIVPYVLRLDIQMKATSSPLFNKSKDHLRFNLDTRICENMVKSRSTPYLLFVLLLPENVNEWVKEGDDELVSKNIMLWYRVKTTDIKPDCKEVELKIPLANRVTKDSLYGLLVKQLEGE